VNLEHVEHREVDGEFDAVVSIGMGEHVGAPQYPRFFGKVRDRLAPDGTALLHTIGVTTPPAEDTAWIRKYIFPGGHLPSASELTAAIERSGLVLTDLEVWRKHYAWTLAEWRRRFNGAWHALSARFDDRFRRMWNFYLAASEAGFRVGPLVVYQAQLSRDGARLPLTRDYLYR
jgi:cyclopropane-fatty-acyl-phospholipid synthase